VALLPPRQIFSCPLSVSVCFQHRFDRAKSARTLPQWFTMSGDRLYKHSAVSITLGTMSMTGYRHLERLVEPADRVAAPQKISVSEMFYPKTLRTGLFGRRSIPWSSAARPCRSSGCDPPSLCVASSLAPRETRNSQGWTTDSERLALAVLPGYPPPSPTPASHRCSVLTPFANDYFVNTAPARLSGEYM
jgi:hypothetical protein